MTYPLTTTRLSIAPMSAGDAAHFVAYRQDPGVARWQSWEPTFSTADATRLIAAQPTTDTPGAGEWLQLALRDRDSGVLHGDVALHAVADIADTFEIGVTVAPTSQHQGFATEGVNRLLDFLFITARAHRVIASCDARNLPVARLLGAVGMRQESHQLDVEFFKGEWITLDGYAILRGEHASIGAATQRRIRG